MLSVTSSLARRAAAGAVTRRIITPAALVPRAAMAKRMLATASKDAELPPSVEASPVVAAAAKQADVQARQIQPDDPMSHRKKPRRERFTDPAKRKAMWQARKYRQMVQQLVQTSRLGRFRSGLYRQATGHLPKKFSSELTSLPHETRQFVQARAMLWRPTQEQLLQHLKATGADAPENSEDLNVESWIAGELPYDEYYAALTPSELETEVDQILFPVWQGLSEVDRQSAMLQVRFDCIRRLGWRTGFTSGYPVPSQELIQQRIANFESMIAQVDTLLEQHEQNKAQFAEESKKLPPAKLKAIEAEEAEYVQSLKKRQDTLQDQIRYLEELEVTDKSEMLPTLEASVEANNQVALTEFLNKGSRLDEAEETEAFYDWLAMTPQQRNEEFHTAWHNRDRSLVYVDNSQVAKVYDIPMPRWYATPERAGHLEFLPDLRVRMVKNFTPKGTPYDAWKATFRTTVDVDKHQLRTYLLQVYGLRTTFVRSMVYRPHIKRDMLTGQKKRIGGKRSFKKFEVGLLEPFIWPEVMPSFEKAYAYDEIAFERGKMIQKADPLRSNARWRAFKLLKNVDAYDSTGAVVASIPTTLLTRVQGIPTHRRNHILEAIHHRKLKEEEIVAKQAAEMLKESKEGQASE